MVLECKEKPVCHVKKKNFDELNILQAMTFIFIFWNSGFTVCFCVDLTSDVEIVLFLTFYPEVRWIIEILFWFTNSSVHLYDHVISKRTEHEQFTFVLLRIGFLDAFNMKNFYYFFFQRKFGWNENSTQNTDLWQFDFMFAYKFIAF